MKRSILNKNIFINLIKDKLNRRYVFVIATLIIVIFQFIYSGYKFGVQDQNLYIPIIKNLIDPSLFSNDPLLNFSGDKTTLIWYLIQSLHNYVSLEIIFVLLQVFSFLAFLCAAYLIIKKLVSNKKIALMTVIVLAPSQVTLMTVSTYSHYFAPRFLALSLCLLALNYILDKNFWFSFLLVIMSIYINAIVGIPFLGMFLIIYLVDKYKENKITSLKYFLYSFISITPLFLFRMSSSSGGNDFMIDMQWFSFAKSSLSLFYDFPLFDGSEYEIYANILGYLAIIITPLLIHSLLHTYNKLVFYIFYFSTVSLFILHYVLVVTFPVVLIMQLQLNRSIILITVLFYILYPIYLYRDYDNNRILFKPILGILMGYLSLGPIYIILNQITNYLYSLHFPHKKILSLILLLVLSIGSIYSFSHIHSLNKINLFGEKDALYEVQVWMRDNTDVKSFFLVPPYIDEHSTASFRTHSERSIFALNSELAQVAISRGLDKSIRERLSIISDDNFDVAMNTGDYSKIYWSMYNGYNNLNETDVKNIHERFGITHVIVEKPKDLNLNIIHENERFIVYVLN